MPTQTPEKWKLFTSTLRKAIPGVLVGVLETFARRRMRALALGFIAAVLLSTGLGLLLHTAKSTAATSGTVNFQARLMSGSGAIAADGYYNVEFNLYSASTGGSSLWTEDYLNTASQGLKVANGYLSANLGSLTAFPSTINWDQNLYLGMTVRGTGSCSFGSCTPADAEMTPRLKLTATPYAFAAGKLSRLNETSGYSSSLNLPGATGGNQIFNIQDQGAAGTYNLLTSNQADTSYLKLQGSTPGTAQTGNFAISGTGIANALQTGSLYTNGSTLSVNANGDSGGGAAITINGGVSIQNVSSGNDAGFTSPLGSTSSAAISIAGIDPSYGNAAISIGLTSATDTAGTGLLIYDARSSAHAPTIEIVSPDESQNFGLSFDGSNSVANLKTSAGVLHLQANGLNAISVENSSGVAITKLGVAGSNNGILTFANSSTSNTVSLQSGGTTSSYSIVLPTAIGSAGQCLVVSTVATSTQSLGYSNCGSTGASVSLQASTPGAADTGSFNITGTGIANTLQATSFDTASAGTLALGNSNATAINIGSNAAAHTLNIGSGAAIQTVTIGSMYGSSTTTIQGGSGGVKLNLPTGSTLTTNINGTAVSSINANGRTLLSPVSDGVAFGVNNANNSTSNFVVDTTGSGTVTINGALVNSGIGASITSSGPLILQGSTTSTFLTPAGSNVNSKINIPLYDPGAYGQILAFGLQSSTGSTSRAITVFDARTSAHQPSISLLTPDESNIFGLSYDGTNGSTSTGYLKATNDNIALSAGGHTQLSVKNTSSTSGTVTIGNAGSIQGSLSFANSSNSNAVIISSGSPSTSYSIQLPDAIGSASQCLSVSTAAGSTQTLGYANCLTTTSGIANSTSLQSAANFNISGTGYANGFYAGTIDQKTAGTLSIGNTNATGINLGRTDVNIQTTINGTTLVKPISGNDSTTAFQVQSSNGAAILNIDSANSEVTIRTANNNATLGNELITNSYSFAAATNWTVSGTGATAQATHVAGSTTPISLTPSLSVPAGTYQVKVVVTGTTSPTDYATVNLGSFAGAVYRDGTYYFTATSAANSNLQIVPNSNWVGTVQSFSVMAITISNPAIILNDSSGLVATEIRSGSATSGNLSIGQSAGTNITSGTSGNTAFGYKALQDTTSGSDNTAIGSSALNLNTVGTDNIAIGSSSLAGNIIGSNNIALGKYALYSNAIGSGNVALGYMALANGVNAKNNTSLGYSAGNADSGGNFGTSDNLQNATSIGAYAQVQASNSIVLGSVDTATKVGIGTTIPLNTFSVSPAYYVAGTATQSGTTVTGTGTAWTSAMVGMQFIFAFGHTGTITAVNSPTSLTLSVSQTEASQSYRIHTVGLQVASTGDTFVQNTSTTAFRIQGINGTAVNSLLTADTSNITIKVSGNTTNFAILQLDNAHFKSTQTTAPTIGTPSNCGTTPTATVTAGSTDAAGSFTVTTGTGGGTTCNTTLTFNKAYGAAPKAILLTPKTATGGNKLIYVSASSTTTFTIKYGTGATAPVAAEANTFSYWVVE